MRISDWSSDVCSSDLWIACHEQRDERIQFVEPVESQNGYLHVSLDMEKALSLRRMEGDAQAQRDEHAAGQAIAPARHSPLREPVPQRTAAKDQERKPGHAERGMKRRQQQAEAHYRRSRRNELRDRKSTRLHSSN